jgi:hypothetical protein
VFFASLAERHGASALPLNVYLMRRQIQMVTIDAPPHVTAVINL